MALTMHPNDCSREARPAIWIFQGHTLVLLVIGAGVSIGLFRILSSYDVDWWLALIISLLPLGAITAYAQCLVNGKPASYAPDLLQWHVFRFRSWLFMSGCMNRPPELWVFDSAPKHPRDF
jgi:hypothetical protein